jgi:hypothetical protein
MRNENTKKLLTAINKLVANNVQDEENLANIYDLISRYLGITNKTEKSSVAILNNLNKTDRKIISIDFDGVIHDYVKGSYNGDSTVIPNSPVPGAIKWLSSLINDGRFFVVIYSARSKVLGFEEALYDWLKLNGLEEELIHKIAVCTTKPPAFLFIDDRNWRFNGKFPSVKDILSFKAWHEEESE